MAGPAMRCYFANYEVLWKWLRGSRKTLSQPRWAGEGLQKRQKRVLSVVFLKRRKGGAFLRTAMAKSASCGSPAAALPDTRRCSPPPPPPRNPHTWPPVPPRGSPPPRAPAPPDSSRLSQGPILSPAVLLPVCVAALLLPGGQPEPALLLSLHPGTGSFPSPLLCEQICLWLCRSARFFFFKGPVLAREGLPPLPRPGGGSPSPREGGPHPRAPTFCAEPGQSRIAFATPALWRPRRKGTGEVAPFFFY